MTVPTRVLGPACDPDQAPALTASSPRRSSKDFTIGSFHLATCLLTVRRLLAGLAR